MDQVAESRIRFMAPVMRQSAAALMQTIHRKIAEGKQRIHS